MTRNQKMYLLIILGILLAFIAVISIYWILIDFNPFTWCINHKSSFLLIGTFIIVGALLFFGYWINHRKRI